MLRQDYQTEFPGAATLRPVIIGQDPRTGVAMRGADDETRETFGVENVAVEREALLAVLNAPEGEREHVIMYGREDNHRFEAVMKKPARASTEQPVGDEGVSTDGA